VESHGGRLLRFVDRVSAALRRADASSTKGYAECDGHPSDFADAHEDAYAYVDAPRTHSHADHHADALDVSGPFRLRPTHPGLHAPDRQSLGTERNQRLNKAGVLK